MQEASANWCRARSELQIMAGGWGQKAFAARLADEFGLPQGRRCQAVPETSSNAPEAEGTCDVLSDASYAEFGREFTEILLDAAPSMTGGQLVQVHKGLVESAKKRGWIDV